MTPKGINNSETPSSTEIKGLDFKTDLGNVLRDGEVTPEEARDLIKSYNLEKEGTIRYTISQVAQLKKIMGIDGTETWINPQDIKKFLQKKAKPSIGDIRLEDIRPEDIRNGHHDPKGLDTFVERNPPKRNTKPENSASKNASNGK